MQEKLLSAALIRDIFFLNLSFDAHNIFCIGWKNSINTFIFVCKNILLSCTVESFYIEILGANSFWNASLASSRPQQ